MNKVQYYFYCFMVGIGFMLLSAIRDITHNTLFLSEFIPREFIRNIEYFFYNIGHLFIIIFGILIFIQIFTIKKDKNN
ncbi:hypothetical protein [Clostridium ganghwense]|uniref:Transposase n=1 Tax=Clostridium ganghwense TaxID=312089 RepID=A0ABT4CNT9_9CLOT|nr:hypothetical protein [Clostridium ganghwense]MCY6370712.1 hypothetical protein [Clostridium ganghwense]